MDSQSSSMGYVNVPIRTWISLTVLKSLHYRSIWAIHFHKIVLRISINSSIYYQKLSIFWDFQRPGILVSQFDRPRKRPIHVHFESFSFPTWKVNRWTSYLEHLHISNLLWSRTKTQSIVKFTRLILWWIFTLCSFAIAI